uniref:Translin-associated protein X n=1 Tax=Mesocestoides corti TaxID=53468 RepID=A0A5K3F3B1_MESCO
MLNLFSKSTGRHYSNKFEYSSNPRRLSVTPSGKTFRRHTYEGGSACADASGTSITSKGLDRLSSFLGIKRKESFQPEYFELLEKHEALERELREIWGLIEYLQRVYEFSKTLDPVTRYRRLKASVKRTSMFLQVFAIQSSLADDLGVYYTSVCTGEYDRSFQNAIQQGSVVGSSAKEAEAFRQREEAFSRLELHEVINNISYLKEDIEILKMKNKLLLAELTGLCDRLAGIRQVNPLYRYFFLKRLIRTVIYGDAIQGLVEHLQDHGMPSP